MTVANYYLHSLSLSFSVNARLSKSIPQLTPSLEQAQGTGTRIEKKEGINDEDTEWAGPSGSCV